MRTEPSVTAERWSAAIWLTVFAAAFFALGVWNDLPYISHPDEPTNLLVVQSMFDRGSANPDFFNYPSLFLYLQAAVQLPFEAIGNGAVLDRLALGNAYASDPIRIVAARTLSVLFAAGVVALSYWIASRISGRRAIGLLAGACVLLSPVVVTNARLITPDIYATFFATAALAAAIEVVRERHGRAAYIVGGAAIGLAAGSKYNAAIVAVALAVAHVWRSDRNEWRNLALAMYTAVAAFLLTTPFALFDFASFKGGFWGEAAHYRSGHLAAEGGSPGFYFGHLMGAHGVLLLFGLVALFAEQWRREVSVILGFATCYLALIASYLVHFERQLLPAVPALLIVAALGLAEAARRVRVTMPVVAAVLLVLLAWPAVVSLDRTEHGDRTADARAWFAALEPGQRIALDWYTPWIDPAIQQVHALEANVDLRDVEPGRYDLVVVPERMIERAASDERWSRFYDDLFARFPLLATLVSADGDIYVLDGAGFDGGQG